MSQRHPVHCLWLPFALMLATPFVARSEGAEPSPGAAALSEYTAPDGTNYFALALKAAGPGQAAGRDVVLLVNTSAGQSGVYREREMAAINAVLAGLDPQDRVRLMAYDLKAVPLMKGFAAPTSDEVKQGLAALQRRVPLGTSDLASALDAAVRSYEPGSAQSRAVAYIGDGLSRASLISPESFEGVVKSLVENKVPVNSYAVGANLDEQLLGALAANTGGVMFSDAPGTTGAEVGQKLAAACDIPVIWPKSVTWPAAFDLVLPKRFPPLRGDRDSVVIGTLKGKGPFDVQVTVDGVPQPLVWKVPPADSKEDNSYLKRLVETGGANGGVGLPLVGSQSLKQAEAVINAGASQLAKLAVAAMAAGDAQAQERWPSGPWRKTR